MDQNLEHRLDRILALTEENNHILRKLRRAQVWSQVFSIVRLLIFVFLTLGAYYYISQYFDTLKELYKSATDTSSQVNHLKDYLNSARDLLN